jgi:hypothetical protein
LWGQISKKSPNKDPWGINDRYKQKNFCIFYIQARQIESDDTKREPKESQSTFSEMSVGLIETWRASMKISTFARHEL